jgi:penicillin-binding protein 1A
MGSRGPFKVQNYENRYSGSASLATATTISDNSVYAEVGYKLVGTPTVARTAQRMGIRTRVSRNPAMVLGGLRIGVTPLELADAYLTLAHGGSRVSGTLASYKDGPIAYTKVEGAGIHDDNHVRTDRVIPVPVAAEVTRILQTVVSGGTGKTAQTGDFAAGKTGTTENYQDAWFVGWNNDLTVAVWVGYPQGAKAMETEYHGGPVAGGTFPAEIWRDFILGATKIAAARDAGRRAADQPPTPTLTAPSVPSTPPAQTKPDGTKKGKGQGGAKAPGARKPSDTPAPTQPPQQQPQPAVPPEPTPQTPPAGGGTGGGTGGTGGAGGGGPP